MYTYIQVYMYTSIQVYKDTAITIPLHKTPCKTRIKKCTNSAARMLRNGKNGLICNYSADFC